MLYVRKRRGEERGGKRKEKGRGERKEEE